MVQKNRLQFILSLCPHIIKVFIPEMIKIIGAKKLQKIVIPLTIMLSIFALLSALAVVNNMNKEAQEGDIEGLTEIVADEAVREAEDALWAPILAVVGAVVIKIVVFVGALFGVKIIVS